MSLIGTVVSADQLLIPCPSLLLICGPSSSGSRHFLSTTRVDNKYVYRKNY